MATTESTVSRAGKRRSHTVMQVPLYGSSSHSAPTETIREAAASAQPTGLQCPLGIASHISASWREAGRASRPESTSMQTNTRGSRGGLCWGIHSGSWGGPGREPAASGATVSVVIP